MSVQLVNVSHIYAEGSPFEFTALKDIHLSIGKNEFIGIIGHTGSGKSTLIQHLNGLLLPTSGTVLIDGVDIADKDVRMVHIRQRVGLVFQYAEHQLFEETIYKDIAYGPKNMGLDEEEIDARVRYAMALTELDFEKYKDRSPFDISGGQMRRVAIAGVLAMKPEVLVLDEPTSGLDPMGRSAILRGIKQMHRDGEMSVVLVSHNMEDVAAMADRIIVMCNAQKVMDDVPQRIFAQTERLHEIGLRAPEITYLMQALKEKGFDVDTDIFSVEKAVEEVEKVLQRRGRDV
jgi:energy-coupling factor transport system ATP-binding protein